MDFDAASAVARRAQQDQDFAAALAAWEQVRTHFPADPAGWFGAAVALRKLGRLKQAGSLLDAAVAAFPTEERLVAERASLAQQCGDWVEAERRWAAVRRAFPGNLAAFKEGGAALVRLRRFDEADALFAEATGRWPDNASLLAEFAAVAESRGETAEAARRWRTLQQRFPDLPASFLRPLQHWRAAARFDEAEALLAEALRRFPDNRIALIEAGRLSQARGLPQAALARWEAVIGALPGEVHGYVGAAQALCDLGRFADAEAVLQPAIRKFPESPDAAALFARLAYHRRDFAEALTRWDSFRARFPDFVAGYTGAMWTLVAMARLEQVGPLMDQAIAKFPRDPECNRDWARVPELLQNWAEAARRWGEVCTRLPAVPEFMASHAQMLTRAGAEADAETMLERAIAAPDADFALFRSYALCAVQRRDWTAAIARWERICDKFASSAALVGLGETLCKAGDFDRSEAVLDDARLRFGEEFYLARAQALTASARRDWPRALARWAALRERFPTRNEALGDIAQALAQARQDLGAAISEGAPPPFEIPAILRDRPLSEAGDAAAMTELFMQFESIGDSCEFGIVQRRFRAEPISLLRWASTPPGLLIRALEARLEGVGEAEHTLVEVVDGEYTTRDRRYHMFSHTFTPETAQPIENFTRQQLRRMQFLRRKLIEDLADGEKIFVYKSQEGLTQTEARALFRAIRRHGPAALLCVRLADASLPSGSVELLDRGLFLGALDRFSTVDINVEGWVALCRRAHALRRAADDDPALRAALAAAADKRAAPAPPSLQELLGLARAAAERGDGARALSAWQAVRQRFPEVPRGWAETAALLREQGDLAAAAALLDQARAQFPDDEPIAVELGWLAHYRGDWGLAEQLWRAVRARFPAAFGGYFGGSAALRRPGRGLDAELVVEAALQRWPDAANLLADYAAIADERGDRVIAARRWATLQARHGEAPESFLQEIRALAAAGRRDEAGGALDRALQRFPHDAAVLMQAAAWAWDAGAAEMALARYRAVLEAAAGASPLLLAARLGAARALNGLGRAAEADTLLAPLLDTEDPPAEALGLAAQSAHDRGDHAAALSRWNAYRARFPADVAAISGTMWTLLALGRRAEVTALLDQAVLAAPDDVELAMDWARLPEHFGEWAEAFRRWSTVRRRFAREPEIEAGYREVLSRLGERTRFVPEPR